ncbi:MAG: hypothetical protein OXH77_00290 [Anaerolineaceae bacterium]|nr:hypothetical protein [Anaerolineaceae bacterium]MDE0608336.1 hypothetical protein [Anaerolineaceae bacterium]
MCPPTPNSRQRVPRGLPVAAYFCLLALIVFATQFAGTGFGERPHHGWVSSHTLAIAGRATPENGFLGHSRLLIDEEGALHYDYFDRYPPFFSATLGALIGLTKNLATKVWLARQIMHIILVLTMLFAWLLLRRLGLTAGLALVGVTLSFSGPMLLYFGEMVHFDHPALAGMLILLYVIARVKLEGRERWRWLTLATLLAVSAGRGNVSLSVLGLWAACEAVALLWQRDRPLAQGLRAVLQHDATRMLLLGVVWSAVLLGYNLAQEMTRRDVPLEETSIVQSMRERLPGGVLKKGWEEPDYLEFTQQLMGRLSRWFLPWSEEQVAGIHPWVALPALALVVFHLRNRPPPERIVLLLTAFSGLAWLYVMIKLAGPHDYTTMHALGFALVFWLALLARLRQPRLTGALLALSVAVFLRSNLAVEARQGEHFRATAAYTEDYDRILRQTGRSGQVIYSESNVQDAIIHRNRYMLGFYLGDNLLATSAANADYIVASQEWLALPPANPGDAGSGWRLYRTLTPENRVAFLFDKSYVDHFPPEQTSAAHHFGTSLALGHWELHDNTQVQPCQRIRVESWWQATRAPVPDYSMQLALVNLAGESLGARNARLTTVDSSMWKTKAWFLDLRSLTVPCDAPAGEYPLVLSVYDPLLLAEEGPLPLINADGSAGDTWLYLTTLFVE